VGWVTWCYGGGSVLIGGLLLCGIGFWIRLSMGLCMSVYVSFICSFCVLRLCM
jgi:hypothetical protein